MIQALLLAILVWTGAVRFWHVALLATILGITNTIDMPARQAFVIELVGREDLMNAIGLNSSIFNTARALGPALAGILISAAGTGLCFFLNGVSFVAVLWCLMQMDMAEAAPRAQFSLRIAREIGEAVRHVRSTPRILTTIILVSAISLFGTNFNVLVPVFARSELHQDAAAFGYLMSAFGAGAFLGAISLTYLSRYGPKQALLFGSGFGLSCFLILLGVQKSFGMTAVLLAFCGWCVVTFFGTANTTVQLSSEDRLRGRVMSLYIMSFGGLSPFGSIFAGAVSHWLQAPLTFAIGGFLVGLFFLSTALRNRMLFTGKDIPSP